MCEVPTMNIKQTPATIEYQKEVTESMFGLMSMVKKHQDMIDNYVSDSLNTQLEDLPGEIWKDIEGYEDKYQISNKGRVKSLKFWHDKSQQWIYRSKILKPSISKLGYCRVTLYQLNEQQRISIHRLVAKAFIPIPLDLLKEGYTYDTLCINHKDENPKNNHVENLEWCTYAYNTNYGTGIERRIAHNQIPISCFDQQGNYIKSYASSKEAAKDLNCSRSNITSATRKDSISAAGYLWRPYNDLHIKGYKLPIKDIENITLNNEQNAIVVSCFDENGNYVTTYPSIACAARAVNTVPDSIRDCLSGIQKSAKKFIWKRHKSEYVEGYCLPKDEIVNITPSAEEKSIPIGIYDLETDELLFSFPSISKLVKYFASSLNHIKKVLSTDGIFRNKYRLKILNK